MFFAVEDRPTIEMLPGVRRQTVAVGERAHLVRITADAGSTVPPHNHPHEQIGTLLSGEMEMTIGDAEPRILHAGEGWAISGGVTHSVRFLTDCVALDIFAPVRQEYLP